MGNGDDSRRTRWDSLWIVLSVVVLSVVVFYWRTPIGFGFVLGQEWQVVSGYGLPTETDQVPHVGDKVLRIGELTYEEWKQYRTASILEQIEGRASVAIELIRDGARLTIDYPIAKAASPGPFSLAWYLPLMFWAAGSVTALFARPRGLERRLLALGWFGTAVWLAAGYAGFNHANYGAVVLHFVLWPTVALQVHLHLLLPWGLGSTRTRKVTVGLLWAVTALMTLLDALHLVPRPVFLLWLLLGISLSVGLILYRLTQRREPQLQAANRLILVGTGLGSSPLALYTLAALVAPNRDYDLWSNKVYFVAFIALLPIWPLSYLYAVHRHAIGGIGFRANRVLAVWAYGAIILSGFLAVYFVVRSFFPPPFLPLSPFLGLLVTVLAVRGWKPFKRWIDRAIFGIHYDLENVVATFTQRIPKVRDMAALRDLVVNELLPSLMIRESLLCITEKGSSKPLARLGTAVENANPSQADIEVLLERSGRYLRRADSPLPWVRLAIPLRIQDSPGGLWLLGGRDPDDFYPTEDIHTLSSLGNVIGSVLESLMLVEELTRSEGRYRTLFEQANDAIFVSTAEGQVLEINQAGLDLLGYESKDELSKKDLSTAVYQDPADRQRLQEILVEQGSVTEHEVVFKRKDGKRILVAASASVIHDQEGRIVAYQGILRDLTDRREMEERLLRSQRMEAIGRLAGGVAHDFNNLLTVILGNAELLGQSLGEDQASRELLGDVSRAGERANSLTRQLLAFGRKQVLVTSILDLREVTRNTVALLRPLIGENIEIVTELQDEPLLIEADAGQIQQVILNLALNAKDAMPRGGKLRIENRLAGAPPNIAGLDADTRGGGFALCRMVDDGVGIPEEDQELVFEPFFTSKQGQEGTGLGLATVYGIVKQSGGHILLESNVGHGSSFEVYLPQYRGEEKARFDSASGSNHAVDGSGRSVLLVEDQAELRRLARVVLERAGFRVLEAADGGEAIERYSDQIENVDLLLTDIVMPSISGPQLANHMTARRSGLKVLFMTGYGPETADLKESLEQGHQLLHKPFKPQALLAAVQEALGDRSVA